MFSKSSLLSTVASATLLGSILALGALAFPIPAHAADTSPTFVFRLQAKTITPPTVVADKGDGGTETGESGETGVTGETGDETGTGSEAGNDDNGSGSGDTEGDGSDGSGGQAEIALGALTVDWSGKWSMTCSTTWTVGDLDAYRDLIATSVWTAMNDGREVYHHAATARLLQAGDGTASAVNSLFFVSSDSEGVVRFEPAPVVEGDPRPYPDTLPCIEGTVSLSPVGARPPQGERWLDYSSAEIAPN